ncbi:MAG: nucleoside-diphosphate kinase [Candidatus Cloacimonadales bacterium]|jgi:nucleoside-diphosphate kinase|nr:nucleoside-diphosphate kinase [Candidatus Cloacimonadota bacterium]MDD2649849.1 nucleoside-diphosphate kinase [Candidatus Cloacimonadota bacterium]MDD3500880.1 nucleoside-diphosphate kinase [Candidatus Cloacimonadota bacterium]MDX9977174.1 nucleoside-diphosphate kinase [Candidatus Cloacimonadales bacterium]
MQHTLLLIKPNACKLNLIGRIIDMVERNSFVVKDIKMFWMSDTTAYKFYEIHKEKPFFHNLLDFMTSGNTVAVILEKENAVDDLRLLVGNTDPSQANPGTIRYLYGESTTINAVHASDSADNALREIEIIFNTNKEN